MKKFLISTMAFILLISSIFTMSACGKQPIEVDISTDLATKSSALFSTYYNQTNTNAGSKQTVSVSNAEYYVEIDDEIAEADAYTVNFFDKKINDTDVDVSIGNNRFISKKSYLIDGTSFYISIPALNIEAKNGVLECYLNDQKYMITVYAVDSTLQVSNVEAEGTSATKFGTATISGTNPYTINHTKSYNNVYLSFTYTQGEDSSAVAANQNVFTKKVVNNVTSYGMDKTGTGGTTFYYTTGYLATDAAYTGTRTIQYTVSIIGIGAVNMTINVSPYVEA